MTIKLIRYAIIFLVVIVASIELPNFYWLSFSERIRTPFVNYSPIIEKFIISNFDGKQRVYYDPDGNNYSREEVDELEPLYNFVMLSSKGLMPDSIKGIKIDLDEVRLNRVFKQIKPYEIDMPNLGVYPLFESKPPRLKLEFPETFFRITDKMEFINCETNEISKELTDLFTPALQAEGFKFPAKLISGNPTTRKPFDEGYFVVDAEDQLFHIKMIDGKPFCVNANKPSDIKLKRLFISEQRLKEFYGIVISDNDDIYLIMYDNYRFLRLSIDDYVASEQRVLLMGNLFYRILTLYSENSLKTYVFDREYNTLDVYEDSWNGRYDLTSGKISKYIFPFTLSLATSNSIYINFNFAGFNFSSIYLNLIFVFVAIFLFRKRKIQLKSGFIDFLIIFFTGIYGFIGIVILKNK